jgi:hypothetical protein
MANSKNQAKPKAKKTSTKRPAKDYTTFASESDMRRDGARAGSKPTKRESRPDKTDLFGGKTVKTKVTVGKGKRAKTKTVKGKF